MKDNPKPHSQQRRNMLKNMAALSTLTLLPAFADTGERMNQLTELKDNKASAEKIGLLPDRTSLY